MWPHDNAIIAAGFKRAGFAAEANHVARAILEAAASFQNFRLPEVFAGLTREPDSFPVQYLGANIPQAWAAGSIFSFVQTMLGLQADAPGKKLYVCPSLPDWVPNLRLSGLQVGQTRLTLRFWRDGERTRFDVESEEGEEIDVVESSRFEPVCPPEAPGNAAGPS